MITQKAHEFINVFCSLGGPWDRFSSREPLKTHKSTRGTQHTAATLVGRQCCDTGLASCWLLAETEDTMEGDVEFKTIESEEIKFGKNNFLEIARKKAVASDSESEFLSLSRGFFAKDGTKRFRRSLALPDEKELIEFVVKKLKDYHNPKAKKPATEKAAEEAAKAPEEAAASN